MAVRHFYSNCGQFILTQTLDLPVEQNVLFTYRNIWRILTYFDGMYYCRFSEANNLNSLGPVVRACEHGSEPSGPALFSANFNALQVNYDYSSCRVGWRKNRRLSKIMK